MNNDDKDYQKRDNDGNEDAVVKPDPETLHTTDPQENMEGPVSSMVQASKEVVEENTEETNKEAE